MSKEKKHIVFVTPGFPKKITDDKVIPALYVYIKALKLYYENQFNFTVVTLYFPTENTNYTWNGIPVLSLQGKRGVTRKFGLWLKTYRAILRIHKKNKIAVIHSFWISETSLIGQLIAKKIKAKHITTAMGQEGVTLNKYISFLSKETKVIALSKRHANDLAKKQVIINKIIPWAVLKNEFPQLKANTIDVLGVGNMNKVKNYTDFIKVVERLIRVFPNLKVEILGDGEQRKVVEALVKKLKLKENIIVNGGVSRTNVLKKMAEAKILLHTSSYESFGYVYHEALYSAMYVVSYPKGCVTPSNKVYVKNNVEGLVNACREILIKKNVDKERILPQEMKNTLHEYVKLYLS